MSKRKPSPAERQKRRAERAGKKSKAQKAFASPSNVDTGYRSKLAAESFLAPRPHLKSQIEVQVPVRKREPATVVAHLGPTNSGKTFEALEFLAKEKRGVFAAPLRMLAQEAYVKLVEKLGEKAVGLVTGEERINDEAPILCVTTEMAPLYGHVLVLDEVQWAGDPSRGYAWTRLLAQADYAHIRLVGAVDALPIIKSAFKHPEIKIHDRLSPLEFIGKQDWTKLEPSTVVIAFSRRSVLFLTDRLKEQYGADRVACLYGAMPLAARRTVLDRVINREVDFVVATDVLGHGVNLPAKTVLFAETEKFDGTQVRNLLAWEAAQIAGRAGRFGIEPAGYTGVLGGMPSFSPNPEIVRNALTPKIEIEPGIFGYRKVTKGHMRPRLEDLGATEASEIDFALGAWEILAREKFSKSDWLVVESTMAARLKLRAAGRSIGKGRLTKIDLDDAWRLSIAPLDPDHESDMTILGALSQQLATGQNLLANLVAKPKAIARMELQQAESAARVATAVRWIANSFEFEHLVDKAKSSEQAAALRVIECLDQSSGIGVCSCGQPCLPWQSFCDSCWSKR